VYEGGLTPRVTYGALFSTVTTIFFVIEMDPEEHVRV
jgi:hypothetical protein